MLQFIQAGGPFMILILIVSLGLFILMLKSVYDLYFKKEKITTTSESMINAILFWGCICALLGFLGQITGIYNAVNAIAQAPDISPQIVLIGFGMSFITSITGLWILLISSIVWFVLKGKYRKIVK